MGLSGGGLQLYAHVVPVTRWSLRPFLEHVVGQGVDIKAVWNRVESALVKTVLTAQALKVRHRHY